MEVRAVQRVEQILGWPTDVVEIDHHFRGVRASLSQDEYTSATNKTPHSLILFVPGNPGAVGWYIPMLEDIVKTLGPGFGCRAISYAGHGVGAEFVDNDPGGKGRNRDVSVSWTVDGQVAHKIAWLDDIVLPRWRRRHAKSDKNPSSKPNMIFLSHSIGAHLINRLLILRPDILSVTLKIVHLMPFFRFDPDEQLKKSFLSTVARSPHLAVPFLQSIIRIARSLPSGWVNNLMKDVAQISDSRDRKLAWDLYKQPKFIKNFLELGLEEIREVPELHDVSCGNVNLLQLCR
mmetsp:Transcript_21670/g.30373  ORF Transcript_21670/g.30373 Transcript_21670/m.30373 type:complete len:290 (+) Transcript_21670:3-872(+)